MPKKQKDELLIYLRAIDEEVLDEAQRLLSRRRGGADVSRAETVRKALSLLIVTSEVV